MRSQVLAEEAQVCRSQATLFPGRPEQPFLLKLAAAFEKLALQEDKAAGDRQPWRFEARLRAAGANRVA
jgi:hypothetical protein